MYNTDPADVVDAKRYRNLVRWFMARDTTFIEQAMDALGIDQDATPTLEQFGAAMDLAGQLEEANVKAKIAAT